MSSARGQAAEVDELRRIVRLAYASRFRSAHHFKAMLLKEAHQFVVKELKSAWDESRFLTGVRPSCRSCYGHQYSARVVRVFRNTFVLGGPGGQILRPV